ncbi:MAG: transglycosylase SLT domain-containing protein [Acidobacteriota bacterium]|nr:transglycosylase SLT domain-containing protein [Acidobacteriota bacterium]
MVKEEIKHPSNDGVGEVRPIAGPKVETQAVLRPVPNSTRGRPKTSVKKPISERHQDSKSVSGRDYSKEEVKTLIIKYSEQYGINPEVPLCIAKLESGYNFASKNRSSSASGVFQYLSGTWKGTDEGKAGLSVFDADANVRAAIKYMASRKSTQPWEVRNKCPQLTK